MIDYGADAVCPWGDWGIAKSVKARDFDSRMRWFESSRPSHDDSLAQLVEHLTFNQGVPGSSPGWITIFFLYINADVAELADAPDLGSGVFDVQVQVLSSAPVEIQRAGQDESSSCSRFFFCVIRLYVVRDT